MDIELGAEVVEGRGQAPKLTSLIASMNAYKLYIGF